MKKYFSLLFMKQNMKFNSEKTVRYLTYDYVYYSLTMINNNPKHSIAYLLLLLFTGLYNNFFLYILVYIYVCHIL